VIVKVIVNKYSKYEVVDYWCISFIGVFIMSPITIL